LEKQGITFRAIRVVRHGTGCPLNDAMTLLKSKKIIRSIYCCISHILRNIGRPKALFVDESLSSFYAASGKLSEGIEE